MNMAEGFRVTGALAWVALLEDEECFLAHGHVSHTATRATERTQLLTHHPAAHCISMATSRPGPRMLEMSARGRGERERERQRGETADIKILRKIAS